MNNFVCCGANMKMNVFTENKCQCNEKMNTRDWYKDEIGIDSR